MKTSYFLVDVTKGAQGLRFVYDWSVEDKIYLQTDVLNCAAGYESLEKAMERRKEVSQIVSPGHFIKILKINYE